MNQWVYPEISNELQKKIVDEFNVHPAIAQVLISRGIKETKAIHEFLYAKLPSLHEAELFTDMDVAVHRIIHAIEEKQNILIYGDNDVDGMTAAALLTEFLRSIGGTVFFDVPIRASMKKSLIGNALEVCIKQKCALLITVDCGITAAKEIQEVAERGIDVIVTDHHEPTSKIPHCIATLNPKLINNTYPNRDLTGVGVAFKLAHAIANTLTESGNVTQIDLKKYLDLVALGTIADMAPLKGENRILVRYGLLEMKKRNRVGLAQLLATLELGCDLTPNDIASKIAPKLNSLGRISDPIKGVELLLTQNEKEAENLCKELDLNNLKRQEIEREAASEIEEILFKHPEILQKKAIVLTSYEWHPGIIAILASRVAKQANRPTLILSVQQGIGKGSLRTTPEFPLLPMLKENQDLLINFGGHDFAAGLTIKEENIETFKNRFLEYANKSLNEQDLHPKIYLDSKIAFEDLTFEFIDSLQLLAPFGNDNFAPILYCDCVQTWPPKVIGQYHLKLFLSHNGRELEGMAFGLSNRKQELQKKNISLRIAFTPHVNSFMNKASIQLQIKDFKLDVPCFN